jgi:hypothetical protein
MKLSKALLAIAAVLLCAVGNANAQNTPSVQMVAMGSSALFLEMGQVAASNPSLGGCAWTTGSGPVVATDTRPGVGGLTEGGSAWIAWQAGSGSCAVPAGTFNVWIYLSTDSTVGNRCVFASPACTIAVASSAIGNGGAGKLTGITDTPLPSAVQGALASVLVNTAGTDIRPEDAKFATNRALTDCGSPVSGVAGSQYLGLGYATSSGSHLGVAVSGAPQGLNGSFHVVDFNLTGLDPFSNGTVSSYTVADVGAVPIVVFVNPSDESGFGSLQVTNMTRGTLAGYLDGTFGIAADAVPQQQSSSGPGGAPTITFVREPLSGTYNTMEYAVPNNTEIQSSQDVGLNTGYNNGRADSHNPCTTTTPKKVSATQNPLSDTVVRSAGNSARYRTIGTGNMVLSVLGTPDSLGYAFWSAANFAGAAATSAKYLTIDGIDPLQQVWSDGLLPTAGNGLLGNVSLANVKNGSYPIWSKLRVVYTGGNAAALVAGAQLFLSPSQPDFVPISQLEVVRSHFAPPYNNTSNYNGDFPSSLGIDMPANGDGPACSATEAGGDVGGLVYSIQADNDFCAKTTLTGGNVGRRQ